MIWESKRCQQRTIPEWIVCHDASGTLKSFARRQHRTADHVAEATIARGMVDELVDPFVVGSPGDDPRTSDSDLEAFVAREIGFKLAFLRENAPVSVRDLDGFSAGYTRYFRTNGLTVDMLTVGYGRSF